MTITQISITMTAELVMTIPMTKTTMLTMRIKGTLTTTAAQDFAL